LQIGILSIEGERLRLATMPAWSDIPATSVRSSLPRGRDIP
jgi:hypothetical protein